jgi:hypothetical protein
VKHFKDGNRDTAALSFCGQPRTSTRECNVQKVDNSSKKIKWQRLRKSQHSSMITLGYHRVSSLIPQLLMDEDKRGHTDMSM